MTRLIVRLRRRPGAFERLAGMLRRRRFPVERASVAFVESGDVDVVLRFSDGVDHDRLLGEFRGLEDVASIQVVGPEVRATREIALAWVRADATTSASHASEARVIATAGPDCLLEMTGSPGEIEATLARFREAGLLRSHVRTEIPAPMPVSQPEPKEAE